MREMPTKPSTEGHQTSLLSRTRLTQRVGHLAAGWSDGETTHNAAIYCKAGREVGEWVGRNPGRPTTFTGAD